MFGVLGSFPLGGFFNELARERIFISRGKKHLEDFERIKKELEEDDMRLSVILTEKLTETLQVANAVMQANRQLLETNAALRSSIPVITAEEPVISPPVDPAIIAARAEWAQKMKAAREAKQAQREADKKALVKRLQQGKKKAAKKRGE